MGRVGRRERVEQTDEEKSECGKNVVPSAALFLFPLFLLFFLSFFLFSCFFCFTVMLIVVIVCMGVGCKNRDQGNGGKREERELSGLFVLSFVLRGKIIVGRILKRTVFFL